MLALVLSGLSPVGAQTVFTWVGGDAGDGSWNVARNWSPAAVPGAKDTVQLQGGSPSIDVDTTVGTLLFSSAYVGGSAQLTIVGSGSTWTGGTLNNPGTLVIASSGSLTLDGNVDHDLNQHTLTNNGVLNWVAGYIRGGNGTVITNSVGATFNDQNSGSYTVYNPGFDGSAGSFVFNNAGTYFRGVGGTTNFDTTFNNTGIVRVAGGRLALNAGGTSTGAFVVTGAESDLLITADYALNQGASLSGKVRVIAGTFAVNGTNIPVDGLSFEGGNLTGTQTFTGGLLSWLGGTWNSLGTTTISSTASLELTTSSAYDFNERTIVNQGTTTWSTGYLRGGNGSAFINNGTFKDQNGSSYTVYNPTFNGSNGSFVFTNNGTYIRNAGGVTGFDTTFDNNGIVTLQGGAIELRGGGTMASTASISAAAETSFTFGASYNLGSGATLNGDGLFRLTNGTLTAAGTLNLGTFTQTGGTLAGNPILKGTFNWNGGNWNAPDTSYSTTIASDGLLTLGDGADHDFNQRTILNQGTITWTSGYLRGGNGSAFVNNGTFKDQNGSSYTFYNPGFNGSAGSYVFTNNGSYIRNAAGTTGFDTTFDNNGTVTLEAGAIEFRGGGTMASTASISAAAGTSVTFAASYNLGSGATLHGAGIFSLTSGTLTAAGTLNLGTFTQTGGSLAGNPLLLGTFNWNGGNWNAPETGYTTTIGRGSTLTLGAGADHDFNQRSIVNSGTVTWLSGYLRGGNGSTFVNNGTFKDQNGSGYTAYNPGFNGSAGSFVFTNNGSYLRNAIGVSGFDTTFDNNGTVTLEAGNLELRGGGSMASTASISAAAGTNVTFTNSYNLASGAMLTGDGIYHLTSGTLTAAGTLTLGNFEQTGGSLAGNPVISGKFTWNGGDWNAPSNGFTTTFATGSTLTLGAGANHDFNQRAIVNNGVATWTSGYIRGGNGSSITNAAGARFFDQQTEGYTIQNPSFNGSAGSFTFVNNGQYVRQGADTTYIDVPFNNNGTLTVQSGDIQFRGGGTMSASGTIAAASDTHVYFTSDYTIADGSSLTGSGAFLLTSGTLTLPGSVTVSSLTQSGGQIAGTNVLSGVINWNGGNWNAPAVGPTTTIASTGTLNIGAFADHDFNQRGIVNNGTVNWNSGYLRGGNGSYFTNAVGATFNDYNQYSYSAYNPGFNGSAGSFVFTNNGTYVRDAGGSTTFNVPFDNNGTLSLRQGDMYFQAGGSLGAKGSIAALSGTNVYFTSGYTVADGGSLTGDGTYWLTGGPFTLSGQVNLGTFNQTGGSLAGSGTLTGRFTWGGGIWNAPEVGATFTVSPTGTLTLSGFTDHDFNQRAIVNAGTVIWSNGNLRGGNGSTFTNNAGATFEDRNESSFSIYNPSFNGSAGSFVFTNNGTYLRTTSGTSYIGTTFNNTGAINLQKGDLYLTGGSSFSATSITTTAAGSTLFLASDTTLQNGARFLGAGEVQQVAGNLAFGTLKATSFTWSAGTWNGTGTATIDVGTVLNLTTGNDKDFNGLALVNNGTVNWVTGSVRSGSGGSFTNNVGAIFNDQNSSGYALTNGFGGTFSFINKGLYSRATTGNTFIDVPFTNSGTIKVTGGKLEFRNTFTNDNGTLQVSNGATIQFASTLNLGTGPLSGTGTIFAPSVTAGGSVSPGDSPGKLTVSGDLTLLSTSTLIIELAGTTQGTDYDFLSVGGNGTLAGQLSLSLLNGFQPGFNQSFVILTAASGSTLAGAFANVASGGRLFTTDGLGSFQVTYGVNSTFATNSVLLSNFVAVPEPSTWALMGVGCILLACAAWRRKSR